MTCQETARAIGVCPRGSALHANVIAHIAGCEHCSRLALLFEGGKADSPQSVRSIRIESAMVRDLKPVRPLARPGLYGLTIALIFLTVLAAALAPAGRAGGWDTLNTRQKVAVFSVLAASGFLLIRSLVRQMAPGNRESIPPAALLAGVPAALAFACALMFQSQQESDFFARGEMCLKVGLSYSVPAGVALWLVLRRGAMLQPWLTGAVLGGFAGLIGLSILEINCPDLNFYHVLAWHGGVLVLNSLIGCAVGALFAFIDSRSTPPQGPVTNRANSRE